ncbi:(2Fe-2S)-binding protein [bacterium]|nr:(2Fe-2S)-binding protein [bacterium]
MSDETVTIFFEGKPLPCRAGLSVGAALWEHGIKVLSHSHKFGRPRGLVCARGQCMSCLMRIDGEPNVRSCQTPVRQGQVVNRQDAGSCFAPAMHKALDAGGHLLPVGFHFKWFTRPAFLRRAFLDGLRPVTGVGKLPDRAVWSAARGGPPAHDHGVLETVVIGAGAAGMRAALAAPGRTLLLDDLPACGGQRRAALDRVAGEGDGLLAALPRLAQMRDRLESDARRISLADRIEVLSGVRVVGAYQPDMLLLKDESGLAVARAAAIVWAGGAWDRLGDFENNDLPGLMGPRALYRLAAIQGLRLAGARTVVCGHGFDLWLSAALLHAVGARVALVPDTVTGAEGEIPAASRRLGWALHAGLELRRATARTGALATLDFAGGGGLTRLPADLAVMCARAKPAHDIPYQLGADLVLDPDRGGFVPRAARTSGTVVSIVGEAAGAAPEDLCVEAVS